MRRFGFLLGFVLLLGTAPAYGEDVQDATIADAEAHQVVLENDHVRVITAIASAGHKSPLHSHPPMVLISMGTARARLSMQDGTSQILDLRPGTVFWSDANVHSWELLAGEIDVVGVEVKSAKMAPAEE